MSERESLSERELADYLAETVYGGGPRSVGEALMAAEEQQPPSDDEVPEAPEEEPEGAPIEVADEPYDREAPEPEVTPEVPQLPEATEEEPEEEGEDDAVIWAKKKYGDDPAKWAAAARAQEQHISRLAAEKKEAENLAAEWYSYSQQVEQQAQQSQAMSMPLSSQEEDWIEQAVMANPLQAAMNAAMNGNINLYNGVIARVAEENPMVAAQIGTQVQRQMEEYAAQEQQQYVQPPLHEVMGESIQRLGIDLSTYGEPMAAKVAELGEHHPYVQTILEGDPGARDIALMAVYDLVRSTAMSTRKVRSEERENQIKHEAELRRQAAGVVTGGPEAQPVVTQSPFMAAMEQEWKDRGQWTEE